MDDSWVLKENWLSRKPHSAAGDFTLIASVVVVCLSALYQLEIGTAASWMGASRARVFDHHELWRLWSALFAHADLAHLVGNLLLFIPFTYFLSAYFSRWLLPLGILIGGAVNVIVLHAMPAEISLIGMSGVVYWMGAVWLTFYVLIAGRENFRRRFAKALVVSLVLFMPETYKPEISYLSHFLGFGFGVLTAALGFILFQRRFRAVEVYERAIDVEIAPLVVSPDEVEFKL